LPGHTFKEFTPGQRQAYQAAAEIYRAFLEARGQQRLHKGGMHWKKIRGREYLYRYRDRYGHGESLGPRSEHTERLFADFSRERREVAARLQRAQSQLREQARFCRAALIHRVPTVVARILRRLEQDDLGRNLLVLGAAAIHAYEFAAGVFLESSGPDLLAEARRRLTLAGNGKMAAEHLARLLRQVDRSFAILPGAGCRAANRDGFLVDLLPAGARPPGRPRPITIPGAREPLPPDAGYPQYLAAAARFSQIVIGQDGLPATLAAPDPRTFALNRLWWSRQEERDEGRRTRDWGQGLAVADLVMRYLPQYEFYSSEVDMFPRDLVRRAARFSEGWEFAEDVTEY
jgi:hypothetical protein